MTTSSTLRGRATVVTVVGGLTLLAAFGCGLLAIGHLGVNVPVLSDLGPGGNRVVMPAAIAFAAATLLYGVVAAALFARLRGAWAGALTIHTLAVLAGIGQFRGIASAAGVTIALAAAALLLTPAARRELGGRR